MMPGRLLTELKPVNQNKMKRLLAAVFFGSLILISGNSFAAIQDEPKPKKDTVNMDTNAKPEKFYEIEDEGTESSSGKGSSTAIILIAAGVVVAGAAVFMMTRKKK
jgi:LPXTG-motif cell wall-anchored protein